jgi:hypothetical protein
LIALIILRCNNRKSDQARQRLIISHQFNQFI